jgi:hypothetical protein
MIAPLSAWQKLLAYASLATVLVCAAIGMAIIWHILTQ